MTLIYVVLATLAAGIGSVWLAALLLSVGVLGRGSSATGEHLLSLAAGALLATAFMHLLPEAFEGKAGPQALFGTLLVGLVFFFLLDKAELWHHGHEHHHGAASHDHSAEHDHAHHHAAQKAPRMAGSWAIVTGDSVHCFGDGVLIASAFIADLRLGLVTALAVLAHEVPHHIGDLVVLRHSDTRRLALIKVSLAGGVTTLGGLVGYGLVALLREWLPFFLVVASSSFIYVALADLIPQLQKRLTTRQTVSQIGWLVGGIVLVSLVSRLAH